MLINISSTALFIHLDQRTITIPRGWLEIELPKALYELWKGWALSWSIYVINGPGSFTNLRIGCLCLNMLQDLTGNPFTLYTIDKISLYTYLYKKKICWPVGLIYIGQQKNGWRFDIDAGSISKVSLSDWHEDYHRIDEYDNNSDQYIDDPRKIARSYRHGNGQITIWWVSHKIDLLAAWFTSVSRLSPNYMIEPNIQSRGI